VWRRVKPKQAGSDDRGSGDEKNPVHYLEVTPSLAGADQKIARTRRASMATRLHE
jgi:hypothetical protein